MWRTRRARTVVRAVLAVAIDSSGCFQIPVERFHNPLVSRLIPGRPAGRAGAAAPTLTTTPSASPSSRAGRGGAERLVRLLADKGDAFHQAVLPIVPRQEVGASSGRPPRRGAGEEGGNYGPHDEPDRKPLRGRWVPTLSGHQEQRPGSDAGRLPSAVRVWPAISGSSRSGSVATARCVSVVVSSPSLARRQRSSRSPIGNRSMIGLGANR